MKVTELFRKEIHDEVVKVLLDMNQKKVGGTPLEVHDLVPKGYVDGTTGGFFTGSFTLAKLTPGGSNGAVTVVHGRITAVGLPT